MLSSGMGFLYKLTKEPYVPGVLTGVTQCTVQMNKAFLYAEWIGTRGSEGYDEGESLDGAI